MIRKGKNSYRRKMEHQLQQNNICGVWKGLKTISGFKEPKSQPVGDQGWANDLNLFFNRFDQASAPPPAQSPLLQPPSHSVTHSVTHSVLLPLPPINTSLLQPAPHITPGEECPEEEDQGQESSRSGWHQLQAPEVLRRPAVWDFRVHVQPEPEAGEECHSSGRRPASSQCQKTPHPKELNSYRPVALTSHLMKTLERLVLAHLRPLVSSFMDPLQFAYQPDIGVDDAVIYLLHTSLTHLEKAGSTVRIMFFDFSSAFNTIQAQAAGGQAAASWGGPSPHYMDFGLPHSQDHSLERFWLLSCSPSTLQTFQYNTPSCHLQKFSDDSAVVGLITDGDDREYRGLIQDFADWCLRNNLQINAGKTKELVVDFRRRSHSPPAPVSIQGKRTSTL
ncbi:hypothetical protein L3Q82_003661 [Scortum barcoo]|uniref:Uncharacterized protein n=1 Tax=Scortum barcoo TaxID=214431 RepID=A0ACB8VN37_9TELE|nr:hypothetical protein L3Q82_003661 [Scortum barcoo]